MNKLSLSLFLTALSVIPTYATPKQKTTSTLAASLLATTPSSLTTDAIATLIADTHKQAHEYALNEQAVLKELITQIDTKIEHYQQLVDNPKKGYWKNAKFFGSAALLAAISYGTRCMTARLPIKESAKKLGCMVFNDLRDIKNKQINDFYYDREGLHVLYAYDYCNKKTIKPLVSKLKILIALDLAGLFIITIPSALLAAGSTALGIYELRNATSAKNNLKKYLMLKNELEKTVQSYV